ncbi:MAG TPA: hypothetical protein VGN57_08560 [Pirellulaceae bacterium]|jgi:hypothetical protein|nr:hypothetical protein [Pirellulaceae bacterium]
MPDYVRPNAEMEAFFAHPSISHHKTRNWKKTGGQRHWFAVDPQLTLEETRDLLRRVPVGAYLVSFDWKYDSPSDPGAYVELQRYPDFWTAQFWNNGGWSSRKAPLDFESAVRLYWDGLLVDPLYFMGYQRDREPRAPDEHVAHSGLSHELPEQFEDTIQLRIVDYIKQRAAEIDETSRTPPNPRRD